LSFGGFGFLEGGTLEVKIQKTGSNQIQKKGIDGLNQWFLFCSSLQTASLFNYVNIDACTIVDNSSCLIATQFSSSLDIPEYIVHNYGLYYSYILNCDKNQFQAKVHLVLLNPDNENLSFAYIPHPQMFIVLLVLWALVTVLWCCNWMKFRDQSSKLQKVITLFPLSEFLYCGVAIIYWSTSSIHGIVPSFEENIFIFFIILEETIFYIVLMLISCGWGINKDQLNVDKFIIGGVLFSLASTRILGFFVHQLFFLLSFLINIIIVVLIFRFVNGNLRDLYIEMRDNPRPVLGDPTLRNPVAEKENMFKIFKVIVLSYVATIMAIALFQLLFLKDYPWMTDLMKELLQLMTFISLGWTFRLKDLHSYYMVEEEDDSYFGENTIHLQSVN